MDPLLCAITEAKNGYRLGQAEEDQIEALAYADDNALLTEICSDMNTNLSHVATFCEQTGMRLNVKKSATFFVKPGAKHSYLINDFDEPLQVKGAQVPLIEPAGSIKYLGSKVSPWVEKLKTNLVKQLRSWLERLSS